MVESPTINVSQDLPQLFQALPYYLLILSPPQPLKVSRLVIVTKWGSELVEDSKCLENRKFPTTTPVPMTQLGTEQVLNKYLQNK